MARGSSLMLISGELNSGAHISISQWGKKKKKKSSLLDVISMLSLDIWISSISFFHNMWTVKMLAHGSLTYIYIFRLDSQIWRYVSNLWTFADVFYLFSKCFTERLHQIMLPPIMRRSSSQCTLPSMTINNKNKTENFSTKFNGQKCEIFFFPCPPLITSEVEDVSKSIMLICISSFKVLGFTFIVEHFLT